MRSTLLTPRFATLLAGIILGTLAVLLPQARAAEGIPVAEAPPAGPEGTKYFYQQAQEYEILREGDSQPLQLTRSPLLNWTNPARTNEQGILVVWLKQGRPAALATLFTYQLSERVYEKHELLSLSSEPLTGRFRGQLAWSPTQPGLKQVEVSDIAPPAKQPRLRAIQMRRIAREFTGTITQRSGETTTLRPLPQPLYRYQDPKGELLDGAIFSLNIGTDPEVLILVEAHKGNTPAHWTCSLARLHYNALSVEREGKPVWSAEPAFELMKDRTGEKKYMSAPYFTYYPQTLMRQSASTP